MTPSSCPSPLRFDAVTCLGVFEFLPDYAPALREIARILRPGGLLVLSIRTGSVHITSRTTSHRRPSGVRGEQ